MLPAGGARAYLASLEIFGIKLGLATMRQLCARLGHPERAWPSLHVAGTNGKGSVAVMLEAALGAAGYRTGCYTSPHLVRIEERVRVEGAPIPPHAFDEAVLRVREAVDALQAEGALDVHPTFFEVTTAAAFEAFRVAGVDVAVVEVGLGGRFDATNVVTPVASAVTSIARDHTQHLGSTLEGIAFEKAGIVKPGRPVVTGRLPEAAAAVMARVAAERGAPLVVAPEGCRVSTVRQDGLSILDLTTPRRAYGRLTLSLRGTHQVENALVAVRVLEQLEGTPLAVTAEAVRYGLEHVRWPARLDLLDWPTGGRVLLDGAHNPAGAAALAEYVGSEWPDGRPVVFGAMRDKELGPMLRALGAIARPLILTDAPGSRAAGADVLHAAARAAGVTGAETHPDLLSAMSRAWRAGDPIVVAGSLYLAGRVLELRERLLTARARPAMDAPRP